MTTPAIGFWLSTAKLWLPDWIQASAGRLRSRLVPSLKVIRTVSAATVVANELHRGSETMNTALPFADDRET